MVMPDCPLLRKGAGYFLCQPHCGTKRRRTFVTANMGLHFPISKPDELERKVASVAKAFGYENAELCIKWLLSEKLTKDQMMALTDNLTTGETYFFRDKKNYDILEKNIIPELLSARSGSDQRFRIWSAGCCTGEEPYSIAISLCRTIPDLKNWNITLLASDINQRFLNRGKEGVYTEWSFRNVNPQLKKRYFKTKKETEYEILSSIKNMVTFSCLNLTEDNYPSLDNNTTAMDIIFCRNVLMYFPPKVREQVVHKLYLSLADGGWLITAPCEVSNALFSKFTLVSYSGSIFFKKAKAGQKKTGIKNANQAKTPIAYEFPVAACSESGSNPFDILKSLPVREISRKGSAKEADKQPRIEPETKEDQKHRYAEVLVLLRFVPQ